MSTILVAGSSGAFFYIADHIIQMDCYKPVEITERVKALCKEHQAPRVQAPGFAVPGFAEAYMAGHSDSGVSRGGRMDSRAEGGHFGRQTSEQTGQERGGRTRGGRGGDRAQERSKVKTFGKDSFSIDRETVDLRYVEQIAAELQKRIETKGWDGLTGSYVPCGLAKPRSQVVFAALNRYRG